MGGDGCKGCFLFAVLRKKATSRIVLFPLQRRVSLGAPANIKFHLLLRVCCMRGGVKPL